MDKIISLCIFLLITSKVGAQTSTLFVADSLFQVGNYSKAIKLYETIENTSYTNTQIAKAYKALGNSKKAIESYEKVLAEDAENTLVLYDYGKLVFTTGNYVKSLDVFTRLQSKDTLNPNFYFHVGLAKEALGQKDYIDAYKTTFNLDAQHQKSIYKLIKFYLEAKEYEEAETMIFKGLTNNEEDVKIIGFFAQLQYIYKQYRKSLWWFEKLMKKNKATQYVYEKAAFAAYRTGKILKAIEYYEEALKRDRGNYFYHSQLARLYYQDGIPDKASFHASQAIAGKMTDPSGDYYILGMVHLDEKEFQKAMKLFKMALEENPDYELAQFRLAQCTDNFYSDNKAKLKMYERFLEKFPKGDTEVQKIVNVRIRELKEEIHLKSD